jgi:signal peptidase II
MSRRPGKWAVLAAIFAVLVVCDQVTKFLAVDRLTVVFDRSGDTTLGQKLAGFYGYRHLEVHATRPYTVWSRGWRMIYVENPGAAWSLFRDLSENARTALFTVISLAAVAFILGYYRRLRDDQRYHQVALALLLAGAVGNFIDRLARRYVIDFIDWFAAPPGPAQGRAGGASGAAAGDLTACCRSCSPSPSRPGGGSGSPSPRWW